MSIWIVLLLLSVEIESSKGSTEKLVNEKVLEDKIFNYIKANINKYTEVAI